MCEFGGLFFGHGRPITMSACLPLEQHKTDCENLSRATLSKKDGAKNLSSLRGDILGVRPAESFVHQFEAAALVVPIVDTFKCRLLLSALSISTGDKRRKDQRTDGHQPTCI